MRREERIALVVCMVLIAVALLAVNAGWLRLPSY